MPDPESDQDPRGTAEPNATQADDGLMPNTPEAAASLEEQLSTRSRDASRNIVFLLRAGQIRNLVESNLAGSRTSPMPRGSEENNIVDQYYWIHKALKDRKLFLDVLSRLRHVSDPEMFYRVCTIITQHSRRLDVLAARAMLMDCRSKLASETTHGASEEVLQVRRRNLQECEYRLDVSNQRLQNARPPVIDWYCGELLFAAEYCKGFPFRYFYDVARADMEAAEGDNIGFIFFVAVHKGRARDRYINATVLLARRLYLYTSRLCQV